MKNFKKYFPFYDKQSNLIYFDSSATSLKLKKVIEAEMKFLNENGSNPHAVDYKKGFEAFEIIKNARQLTQEFINAKKANEIIFTSGTTHSINLLANGLKKIIKKDDEILVTELEHSANLLPWIALANSIGAKIKKIKLNEDFTIDQEALKLQLSDKTKIVSFASVYNTVGAKNDVKLITNVIKEFNNNIIVHVDAAQSIGHTKNDVTDSNIDFMSWSFHKMYGPFGVGCLYGKYELLNQLEPLFYGGGMSLKIEENLIDYSLSSLPEKLEGGTPNISAIAGVIESIKFINSIGLDQIEEHELTLKDYFKIKVKENNLNDHITFYNLDTKSPIILFNVKGVNPQDITNFLDEKYNVLVRGGANCARRIEGVIGTKIAIRASFGINNNKAEIDQFIEALKNTNSFLDVLF
ncbi:aminotransferase class V-fold PLP-dependent enzyme [Mesoplasma coleopterae]|uniref:aminotransferase class V-fold PLP-dependent enzyme n=1 Tax=Mesoplasma coleopterae TaxID=324078 RepID=UPI000D026138|nr:aminotransferase class V-fold PLP-dependent enzyme [Mesoplasma coleopterae]AVN62958.1 aminotransferase [Mesoplasma coleopterae]